MGSGSVTSCRCCMFVSCVHPVAVFNAAFCMTCNLLMLVDDARSDCMDDSHECILCVSHPIAGIVFISSRGLCACTEML